MSEQKNKEPFDDLIKSVIGVIEADQSELQRLREQRDDWKNRYFVEAEKLGRIETILRRLQDDSSQINTGSSFTAAVGLVTLAMVIVLFFVSRGG
jgi:hypothetical protein